MATQYDVAKLAKVSIATVSRYINDKGYISPEYQKRIKDAIEELNYIPNLVARSLKVKSTRTIGLVFPDIDNPFFIGLIKSAEETAQKHDYSVILCNTKNNPAYERKYIEVLKGKVVDGYIIIPTTPEGDSLEDLLGNEKVVYVDRCLRGRGAICVRLDNKKGVRLALEHLFDLGHRRIAAVCVPTNITTGRERLEGYIETLENYGYETDPELIRIGEYSAESSYEQTKKLLEKKLRPTAVIFMSGLTTLGGIRAVKELSLKVPEDLSVVSFDDFETAELLNPPLTTIVQPAKEFGRKAIEILVKLIGGKQVRPNVTILSPELLLRESCRPIR
jgi:LacI family transcriptional regulator